MVLLIVVVKFVIIIHKKNGGLSDARNVGIEIAKGEFIGFIDSDDMISNKMYETLYTLITDYNADISWCDLIRFSDTIPQIKNKKNICIYNQEEYLKLYFKINSQSCEYYAVTKLYKRSVLENENFPLNLTAEDVLGTYKTILKANTIVKTDEILYYYRKNAESITGKFTEKDMDLICIWDKVVELTQKKAPKYLEYAILNRKRINFTLLMRMAINMNKKELKENELVLKLLNELKKDEKNLLRSPITLNRKILIFLFCRNYYFFAKIIRILKGGN